MVLGPIIKSVTQAGKRAIRPLDYEQVRPSKKSVREGRPSNVETLQTKDMTLAHPLTEVARRRSAVKGAGIGAGAVGAGVGIKEGVESGDVGPAPVKAKSGSYKVKKGDTLAEIAMEHGVTVKALMKANPSIKNKDTIKAGDTIKIPRIPRPTRKPKRMSRGGSVGGSSTSGSNSRPKGVGAALRGYGATGKS
jgi:LysM repeat protein